MSHKCFDRGWDQWSCLLTTIPVKVIKVHDIVASFSRPFGLSVPTLNYYLAVGPPALLSHPWMGVHIFMIELYAGVHVGSTVTTISRTRCQIEVMVKVKRFNVSATTLSGNPCPDTLSKVARRRGRGDHGR
jgi:hypothetical protein